MKIRDRLPWAVTAVLFWIALIACGGQGGGNGAANGTLDPSATPDASATQTTTNDVGYEENSGFRNNLVQVINQTAGRLRIRGHIQLNRISGPDVQPGNAAIAIGKSCTGCQTFAVALQLNLYAKGSANNVSPQNYAVAANAACNSCVTVAHAVQYTLGVDDPKQDVADVRSLINAMQQELNSISSDSSITADQAEARIEAVIARFNSLAGGLRDDLKRTDATDTPSASPSGSPSASASASPSITPPSAAPSATPTASPSSSP
jgi:hypothetical protein